GSFCLFVLFVPFLGHLLKARNPRFGVAKRSINGNTAKRSAGDKPYQVASVAAYCSTDVVGIQRPRGFDPPSVSSGPPSANVGYAPYNVCPCTEPPTIS